MITLSTNDIIYHIQNTPWTNPTIYVPHEGDYSAHIYGVVDETSIGTYELNYEVTDELNNTYNINVIVHVVTEVPDVKELVYLENLYRNYNHLYRQVYDVDKNQTLVLDSNEVLDVLEIEMKGMNLSDTELLKHYEGLLVLQLDNNELYDLDFIVSFPVLESLSIATNNIEDEDLCVLTNNTTLVSLNLSDNFLQDTTCIGDLSQLEQLDLSDNNIYDLTVLGALPVLKDLNIANNPIDDFLELLVFDGLEVLNIDGTDITDISSIDELQYLEIITLNEYMDDYYIIDYLLYLEEVHIVNFDADLYYSFFFDYLEAYGIEVHVKSTTEYDLINPYIMLYDTEATIKVGDSFDFSTISFEGYDYIDSYFYDGLISNIIDTSVLEAGEHIALLSYTDSDGHTTTVEFTITVLDDYDLGNLVVFIRFSDETEFVSPYNIEFLEDFFNGSTESLRDYYLEVSNNEFIIDTVFPSSEVVFYTDSHPRGYYQPYDAITNPIGYEDDDESYYREQDLLTDAINWLDALGVIEPSTVLDYDNNGEVDVVSFLISGHVDDWAELLWPHKYALYESTDSYGDFLVDAPTINGDYVFEYTLQLIGDDIEESPYFDLGTFAHEMFHIIGAPDLYHYYSEEDIESVGNWGLMDSVTYIPSHMLGYMKEYYGRWDQDQIDVIIDGTYILSKSTSVTDNLIVIDLGYSNEYLYIEYRQQTGTYEINLEDKGLLVYRVDKDHEDDGNIYGYYSQSDVALEEVFLFRPFSYDIPTYTNSGVYYILDDGDPDLGMLTLAGNSQAGPTTSVPLFYSDGTEMDILITIISETEDSIEITIDFLDE